MGKEKAMHFVLLYENQSSYSDFFFFFVFWTDEAFLKSIPAQVWITSKPFEKNFQNQFVRRCLILTLVVYSSTSTSPRCFAKNKLQKKCEVAADEQPCWHFNFIPAASIAIFRYIDCYASMNYRDHNSPNTHFYTFAK